MDGTAPSALQASSRRSRLASQGARGLTVQPTLSKSSMKKALVVGVAVVFRGHECLMRSRGIRHGDPDWNAMSVTRAHRIVSPPDGVHELLIRRAKVRTRRAPVGAIESDSSACSSEARFLEPFVGASSGSFVSALNDRRGQSTRCSNHEDSCEAPSCRSLPHT